MKKNILAVRAATWGSVAALVVGLAVAGCGGGAQTKKEDAEPVGSLTKKFTLVDEQGRKSGTLVLNPLGGAELRDSDGRVIGTFHSADKPAAAAAETQESAPPKQE